MRPPGIVIVDPGANPGPGSASRLEGLEIISLVIERPPLPLDHRVAGSEARSSIHRPRPTLKILTLASLGICRRWMRSSRSMRSAVPRFVPDAAALAVADIVAGSLKLTWPGVRGRGRRGPHRQEPRKSSVDERIASPRGRGQRYRGYQRLVDPYRTTQKYRPLSSATQADYVVSP